MKTLPMSLCVLSVAVASLSAAPGDLVWSYATGGPVRSSPAVADGRLYVTSGDTYLYCLDADTGAFVWSYQLNTGGYPEDSSPAVWSGYVYANDIYGRVHCLNAETGAHVWSFEADNPTDGSPAVYGGCVYIGTYDGPYYCLNALTGDEVWENDTAGRHVRATIAIADDRLHFGAGMRILCRTAGTGSHVWLYSVPDIIWASCAVSDGRVFTGCDDGKVYAVSASTGAFDWFYQTGDVVNSSAAIDRHRLFIGSNDNKLYSLDPRNGNLRWTYLTGGDVESSPAVSGDYVYFGSEDGMLYCIEGMGGAHVWHYDIGSPIVSSPASVGGRVYVGADDNSVYCFDAGASDPGDWPMFRHNLARTGEHRPAPIFEVPLLEGWNLIGYGDCDSPDVLSSVVYFTDGESEVTWWVAAFFGWIQEPAYCYAGPAGYMTVGEPSGTWDDDSFRPGYGYWLLTFEPGLTLRMYR